MERVLLLRLCRLFMELFVVVSLFAVMADVVLVVLFAINFRYMFIVMCLCFHQRKLCSISPVLLKCLHIIMRVVCYKSLA